MNRQIARLHIRSLPHTWSSARGERFVAWLYRVVGRIGYLKTAEREGRLVGVGSGIGRWILTLAVDPEWQGKGIGRELIEQMPGKRYVYTEECTRGFYEKMGFERMFQLGKIIFLWRK